MWLPILVHAANNLSAWLFEIGTVMVRGETTWTLADLRAEWWYGPIGLIVCVTLFFGVLRPHWRLVCSTK